MNTAVVPIKKPRWSAPVITCAVILTFVVGNVVIAMRHAHGPMTIPIIGCLFVAAILAVVLVGMAKTRFEVSDQGFRIRGDMWGRSFSWTDLDVANVRVININEEPGYKPFLRTCGTGLPGYSAGWFRLRNKTKALVFMTAREVVFIPTRKNFAVLVSSENNSALLKLIQECGGKL